MLFGAYAAFGTIVWGAYLALDPSPRRMAPVEPEPLQRQALAPEQAWQDWARRQAEIKARVEALSAGAVNHQSAPIPPLPMLKPLEAATIASITRPAPTPTLKPADARQGPHIVPAIDRARGEDSPGSFWSRIAALFESSAIPIAASQDGGRDEWRAYARDDGSNDRENSGARNAGNASRSEAGAGGGTDRDGNSSGSAGGTQGDGGRSAGDDRGGDNGTSGGRGDDRGRSANDDDRGRDSARSDRGRGVGNDRDRGDRGGRGGRGGRGDRGDRGRG